MNRHQLARRFMPILLACTLSWFATACQRASGPSAQDFMAAKAAMPLRDLLFKVRAGAPRSEIVEEVVHRHLCSPVTPDVEAQLVSYNAGAALLAAVKDERNVLTEKQQEAYRQLAAGDSTASTQLAIQPIEVREAQTRNAQNEAELQRRDAIARENMARLDQKAQLQSAQERVQANSRPRLEGGREIFGSVYQQPRPYSTPARSYPTPANVRTVGARPQPTATPFGFTLNSSP